jgi:hypothetical protein
VTITVELRAKVVRMHLEGHGRNEIARILSQQGLHISEGSVGNIVRAYHKHEQQSDATISTGADMNNVSSPVSMVRKASFGFGPKPITGTTSSSNVVTSKNGGPLLHLLDHETIDRHSDENSYIDFASSEYHIPFPPYRRPILNPVAPKALQISSISYKSGRPNFVTLEEPVFVSEEQVDIQPDVKDVLEEELMGVLSPEEIENSKSKVRDTSESIEKAEAETLFTETNKLAKGPSIPVEERLRQEKIAWDYYGPAWMRIIKQIRREKDQRRHELLVIDRRKQKLSEWKKRLEQMQYDLTARETRILESEPFLPLARQLQEMKLGLEDALPWIETVKELAQMQNMDIKAAVVQVAQELRLYRQSWGIQKQIERANQELALINMESIQNQQALAVLRDLLNRGVTESQIVQLINFASEWDKYWKFSTTNGNLQQPVNGGNNPGSSGGNGYGGNFQ